MRDARIVVLGGSSGIGFRVAELAIAAGAEVMIGGRDPARLDAALAALGPRASGATVDATDATRRKAFFSLIGSIDHLFTPGAAYRYGRIDEIDDETAESPFRTKFWGQYYAVRDALPRLSRDGSIVLMSGAAGARPLPGAAAYAACNSAIEGLGRALALELAPIRVNVVAPGTIDSDLWRQRPQAWREEAYAGYSALNPLKRVGTVDEVADAVLFLMRNTYTTGSTLFPDGGYVLR